MTDERLLIAIASLLGMTVQNPRAQHVAGWVECALPRLAEVADMHQRRAMGGFHGWVQLNFEHGEVVEVLVADRGHRLKQRLKQAG
jgi:hypothetical protein